MKIGDRVKVISKFSSLNGYTGTIRDTMYENCLSIQLDGRTNTIYFDRTEVEVIDEV